MSRLLPLAFLAASIAHAAPAPKGKDAVYFPTKVGDVRVYEVRSDGESWISWTDTVTKVEQKDGALHVTMTREREGLNPLVRTYAVSKDGVFRIANDGAPLDSPIPVFKMPAKVGTEWRVRDRTYSIVKEAEVEVPAGKFRAVCVESEADKVKTFRWFAPNVGLIKVTDNITDRVEVLREFKPGK